MSMAEGQALMLKLATKLSGISTKAMTLDQIKASLKSTAMSSSIFMLKIDSGEKADWLIKSVVPNQNPTIISPTSSDTPKSFQSKSEAEQFKIDNNLYYYQYEHGTSTISSIEAVKPNPASENNVSEMANQLSPNCLNKNKQTWSMDPPRKPTPAEFKQVIESKILSFS